MNLVSTDWGMDRPLLETGKYGVCSGASPVVRAHALRAQRLEKTRRRRSRARGCRDDSPKLWE
jgi:hypothetical protein